MPMQSPISVNTETAISKHYQPFRFKNYNHHYSATITNTGDSVKLDLIPTDNKLDTLPSLSGGGLFREYILTHIVLHWDAEHVINEKRHPLEVQLVHYGKSFGNEPTAKEYRDGIAIISSFFGTCDHNNATFDAILEKLPHASKNLRLPITLEESIVPRKFLSPIIGKFYRYQGSMTHEKYEEVVTWTIFTAPSYISHSQIAALKLARNCDNGLQESNNRELQNDRNRRIYLSKL